MLRQLKREVCFLIGQFRITGLCAFLCCMGGILLWVSGGSNIYWMRGGGSIGGLFFLWLLIYGLTGVLMACILLSEGSLCPKSHGGVLLALCGAAYVLMLCWYAVYFCTRLTLFSGILLILSILCIGAILVIMRKGFLLAKLVLLLAETGQILSFVYCYFMNLLI